MIEDGAVVHESVIMHGATIGGGAVVSGSVVGPLARVDARAKLLDSMRGTDRGAEATPSRYRQAETIEI